ncbi:MAG TPA: radical SAM protein [Myxococcota bacterium]|nr:radical SAM protein [Myxococcota bacterium]HQK50185.1 radical SAM protein [Myxococcota bacterium]
MRKPPIQAWKALWQWIRYRRVPLSVTFVLTNRCNQTCSYCDIRTDRSMEMSTDAWIAALQEFHSLGLVRASFSGGEVLLRADLSRILSEARSLGMTTSINTNGSLLADRWPEIAPWLDMLVLSLDGPREVHDARCGRRGSFDRVLEAIRLARRSGVPVATIFVADRDNLATLPFVMEMGAREGFFVYVQPRHASCFSVDQGLGDLDSDFLQHLGHMLERARRLGLPIGASRSFVATLLDPEQVPSCRACAAGNFFATVLPDGELIPCHLTRREHPRDLVAQGGVEKAWRSLAHPWTGRGCLIAPYQELNRMFHLDPEAIRSALMRLAGRRR